MTNKQRLSLAKKRVRTKADQTALDVAWFDTLSCAIAAATRNDVVTLDHLTEVAMSTSEPTGKLIWPYDDLVSLADQDKIIKNAKGLIHIAILDTCDHLAPDIVTMPGYRSSLSSNHVQDETEKPRQRDHSTLIYRQLFDTFGILRPLAEAGIVEFSLHKVMSYSGMGYNSDIMQGIKNACEMNYEADCLIINMSFGSNGKDGSEYEALINPYVEAGKNIIFTAAAGNDGSMAGDTINLPARIDNVIAVGAYNQKRERSYFSSRGDTLFVMAPGEMTPTKDYAGEWVEWNGTSSADPYACAVIAHIATHYGLFRHTEMAALLKEMAGDVGAIGFDVENGHGVIPIDNFMGNTPADPPEPEPKNEYILLTRDQVIAALSDGKVLIPINHG